MYYNCDQTLFPVNKNVSELVEFASDAAFVIDVDARIVAWNAPAQQMLGYSSSEVIGLHCGEVLQATLSGGELLCHGECDILQCFRKCRPYGVPNCRLRHRDGTWIAASMASIAMSPQARRLHANKVMAVIFVRDWAPATPMPQHHTLQVFTLGGFGMMIAGRSVDTGKWKRKQAVTLLKFLVTQLDRPVHRGRLLELLWPGVEEQQGRGRLKVIMYYLRCELRANNVAGDVIKTVGNAYQLRRDAVWVDADAFERQALQGRKLQEEMKWSDALERYDEAQHLYQGDYLEEETFTDWCAEERGRLYELHLDMLVRIAECHAELGQFAESVNICRKALVFDPCRENFHYALMEYLVSYGYPELALVQYRRCEQVLKQEFDATPLLKTQRLYQRILKRADKILIGGLGA